MNLSGNNIKKYILRRYSIDELESILNQKLNNQSRNFKHYAHMSSNKFMVIVVSLITEEILVQLTDGWVEDSPIPEEGLYEFIQEIFGERIIKKYDELTNMNLQESIRRILREELTETRVPREERVELYKDDNIIVIVPLSHRALQKYAHKCQWCINDDRGEWEDYHQKKHAVIVQRKPKKNKKGITGMETEGEIFLLSKLDDGDWDWNTVTQMLGYDFGGSKEKALDYFVEISNDINNFNLNIVYYSPENGIYDMEDNFLWNYDYEISDIPNVTDEVINIMDEYLTQE